MATKRNSKEPSTATLRPMTPAQVEYNIEIVERIYKNRDAKVYDEQWKDEQLRQIAEASKLWARLKSKRA
jgi:hypothetical protein